MQMLDSCRKKEGKNIKTVKMYILAKRFEQKRDKTRYIDCFITDDHKKLTTSYTAVIFNSYVQPLTNLIQS